MHLQISLKIITTEKVNQKPKKLKTNKSFEFRKFTVKQLKEININTSKTIA